MISTSSNKIDEIVAPDEIETYVSMPSCLLQGCSNDLIIFRADIERVRAALKALTPEERDIIMNFYFSENPLSGEALAEKFATTKSSIYRRRDHALRKLKSILGNA